MILGLLGLVAGGVGLYTSSASAGTDRKTAESDAKHIAVVADAWRDKNGDVGCPSVSRLTQDKSLESGRADDPWGGRYRIECEGPETTVRSPGRDGRFRTADDVVTSR